MKARMEDARKDVRKDARKDARDSEWVANSLLESGWEDRAREEERMQGFMKPAPVRRKIGGKIGGKKKKGNFWCWAKKFWVFGVESKES